MQGQPEKKVRDKIPAHRLLDYNVKQGWALCEFLNKDIPGTMLPHVNDYVVVQMMVFTCWLLSWVYPLGPILAPYAVWKMVKFFFFVFFFFFRRTTTSASNLENDARKQD